MNKRKGIFKKFCAVMILFSVIGIIPVYAEPVGWEDWSIRLQSVQFDPVLSIPPEKSVFI